jgi:hypothetical protein
MLLAQILAMTMTDQKPKSCKVGGMYMAASAFFSNQIGLTCFPHCSDGWSLNRPSWPTRMWKTGYIIFAWSVSRMLAHFSRITGSPTSEPAVSVGVLLYTDTYNIVTIVGNLINNLGTKRTAPSHFHGGKISESDKVT